MDDRQRRNFSKSQSHFMDNIENVIQVEKQTDVVQQFLHQASLSIRGLFFKNCHLT